MNLSGHRFFTQLFQPLRFWLQIHGDICNRKLTPRIGDSSESTRLPWVTFFLKPLIKPLAYFLASWSFKAWFSNLNFIKSTLDYWLWLPVSQLRRVDASLYHRYAESVTPCVTGMRSQQLNISAILWVFFLIQRGLTVLPIKGHRLPISSMQEIINSAYHQCRELLTQHMSMMGSH